MSEVAVKFTADEAALWQALNKLVSAHHRHEEAADKTTHKFKGLDQELARFAKRTKEIDSTPLERHGQSLEKLRAALSANLITSDQFARAEQRVNAELAKATTVVDQEAVALQRFGEQLKQIHATPLDNYTAAIQKARAALAAGAIDQATFNAEAAKQASAFRTATTVVDQEADAIKRFGQQLRQIHSSPLENYHAAIGKARQALAAGAIDQRTFNAEAAKQNEILTKATTVTDAAAAELKQFAAETKRLNVTPLEAYHAKLKRLDEAVKAGALSHRDYTTAVQREKEALDRANEAAARKGQTTGQNTSLMSLAIGKLGPWAAGLFTVQRAIQAVTSAMREKMEVEKEALQSQNAIAKSQADAAKNLSGLSKEEKEDILNVQAPKIQKETGFPELARITEAIGAGFSSSGDKELTLAVVKEAARISPHSPEQLPTIAAGMLDLSRGTGVTDPAALSGFLLSAGGPNRIDKPEKLAENLAPVVAAGTAYVPNQMKTEAAKDVGAVFAATTKFTTDKQGDRSKSNVNTLLSKMDDVFQEFKELDPGTWRGRIEAIQNNPQLKESLFSTEWGDASAKKFNRDLFEKGSAVDLDVIASRKQIGFKREMHEQLVEEVNTATPQMKAARQTQKTKAGVEAHQQASPDAFNANVENITATTLKQTRGGGGAIATAASATKEWFGSIDRNYLTSDENKIGSAELSLHNRKMREAYGPGIAFPGVDISHRFDIERDSKKFGWTPQQKANIELQQQAQDQLRDMRLERDRQRGEKKENQPQKNEAANQSMEKMDAVADKWSNAADNFNDKVNRAFNNASTQRTNFAGPSRALANQQPE